MDIQADFANAETELERLGAGEHLADPIDMALQAIDLLTPPELISTTECAAKYRYIPAKEGDGKALWDPTLTPYMNGIQDALDDPMVGVIIVPKPARTGGTVAAENHLHKRLKFGPLTDVLWYLPSDSEVDAYTRRHVSKFFELHTDIAAKVGRKRTDDTMKNKVVGGRRLEWLQINARTITGRDAGYIVVDEIDAAPRKLRMTMVDQVKIRGSTAGTSFKGYLCSHMDAGWTDGIAAAWKETSRGIWYQACPHCGGYSSPCPTAPKGWRMKLDYVELQGVSDDELLDHVEATAGMLCPHCGKKAAEVHKRGMLLSGKWVHEGQTIDRDGNVTGEPKSKRVLGFWIHGTMSPWVAWSELARDYVAALLVFRKTKKSERLREVTAKKLGEVYEGGDAKGGLDPQALEERSRADELPTVGVAPEWVLFCTASVDVGGAKFDVLIRGWDLEGRSHVIDRITIRQREVYEGGRWIFRDLRPAERQDDWLVLEEQVLQRVIPLEHDPTMGLPIAGMAVDTGDGHVTWRAREFARQMARKSYFWGRQPNPWQRVRLIKGAKSPEAPELPVKPREVNKDEKGKDVTPSLLEYDLGVNKLKQQAVERLRETEGGPGQVTFARGLPASTFTELTGEVEIDGKWERRGPNETLDLMAYDEAVRQMLRPERAEIRWDEPKRRPVWARPVPIDGEDEADEPKARKSKKKQTIFERIEALNEPAEER